jgi:hypothetical protein
MILAARGSHLASVAKIGPVIGESMSDGWRNSLQSLRNDLDILRQKSNGLYSIMTECKIGVYHVAESNEFHPPWVTLTRDGGRWSIVYFDTRFREPPKPRKLTEEEYKSAPPAIMVNDPYIRNLNGKAVAKWCPEILRPVYLCGDAVIQNKFSENADAIGRLLENIPDNHFTMLREDVRSLCLPRPYFSQVTYKFDDPDGGVVINGVENSSNIRSSTRWIAMLHILGWNPPKGSPLCATRYYWKEYQSLKYGSLGLLSKVPDHFYGSLTNLPTDRFYSVLGSDNSHPLDICDASAWGIDAILDMTHIAPVDDQTAAKEDIEFNRLTSTQQELVTAAFKHKIDNQEKRISSDKLTELGTGNTIAEPYKKDISELVRHGWLASKTGRKGGVWLGPKAIKHFAK